MAAVRRIAVLDVGRTHTRLAVVEAANGAVLSVDTWSSAASLDGPYPHLEVERTEARLFESLRSLVDKDTPPNAIVPVTHGASAALLDGEALALPVFDYTAPLPSLPVPAEHFAETLSPPLPGALNLGSQLAWLEAQHAEAFGRADTLLPYPQYWAWRLTGARAAEVTSLGCHTHLWDPRGAHPSRLATERGWDRLLPPLARADAVVGTLLPHVQEATGLPASTQVLAGIHDSNAAWWSHRRGRETPFSVVSTGTWAIVMASRTPLEHLRADRDQLANVEVGGAPVATMRFPGGLEREALLRGAGGVENADAPASIDADLLPTLREGTLALPAFDPSGGPFRSRRGEVTGPGSRPRGVAALYGAWVIDLCLDELGAVAGDVIVEGPGARDDALLAALATLRAPQSVLRSTDPSGSLRGAAALAAPSLPAAPIAPVAPLEGEVAQLLIGRTGDWRRRVEGDED